MTREEHASAFDEMFPHAPNPIHYPRIFQSLVDIYKHVNEVKKTNERQGHIGNGKNSKNK